MHIVLSMETDNSKKMDKESPHVDIRSKIEAPTIVIEGENGETMDKYTAGIELSNACRRFYVSRLQAAEKVKEKLGLVGVGTENRQSPYGCANAILERERNNNNTVISASSVCRHNTAPDGLQSQHACCPKVKPTTSIDTSMNLLKREMVCL